jgi:hypothetical protein
MQIEEMCKASPFSFFFLFSSFPFALCLPLVMPVFGWCCRVRLLYPFGSLSWHLSFNGGIIESRELLSIFRIAKVVNDAL